MCMSIVAATEIHEDKGTVGVLNERISKLEFIECQDRAPCGSISQDKAFIKSPEVPE